MKNFDTRAVRSGQVRTAESEHNDPIFLTSSFVFESARQAAARFAHEEEGNVYSRFTNPTVRTFEERLAALEGAEHCIGTSSGMSAVLASCLACLKSGDHIVAAHDLFGSTVSMFCNVLSKFGIQTTFVSVTDHEAWKAAIRPETRFLFIESPTNPLGDIADIAWLANLAHDNDCWLVVDNCLCTPALQLPFELGADIVIHSATKFIDGQGRCIGGAVLMQEQEIRDQVFSFLRTCGPTMSPFNAWVFLNGLETLSLRMRAHCDGALALARRLEKHPAVAKVYYPGLESHPQHALAARQQKAFGSVVAFEVHGGRAEAWSVIDATRFLSITANLGDAKTTITHPASTTHSRITQEQRDLAGIRESLIRVAVGLEDIDDIDADLTTGLDALTAAPTVRAVQC
jgi:O-succinylhomoserine sulfhydrylase